MRRMQKLTFSSAPSCLRKVAIIDDADDLEKDEEEEDIPPPSRHSNREIEESLDKIRDLSLFSNHGDEIQSLTLKLEALLDKERLQNLQQRPCN